MPPATDPIPLIIVQNIATALAGIDGGDDYFTTVNQVVVANTEVGPGVVTDAPGVVLITLGTDPDREQVIPAESSRFEFNAYGVLEDGDDDGLQSALIKFARDIQFAVMADIHQGTHPTTSAPLAIDTDFAGWNIELPIPGEEPRSWCECRFSVHYRTSVQDMTTQV